jgi:hypothetical protein
MSSFLDPSQLSLVLLLPTAALWGAVLLHDCFGARRPLRWLIGRAPDALCILLALVLPFAAASVGLWQWSDVHAMSGLATAAGGAFFLLLAVRSALKPLERRDSTSLPN